ncbi:hypothetical protein HI031_07455 [Staphylococcus haemolyticus]|nr:hypothetical protein HI031_07455 [Staphylococcus haemolyticus]
MGNWRNKFFNERKGKYQTENKVIEKRKNYKGKAFVNGRYINTKLGKVHYSKTGTHVVPYIYFYTLFQPSTEGYFLCPKRADDVIKASME